MSNILTVTLYLKKINCNRTFSKPGKTIILSNANTISAKKKKEHFSVIAPPSANSERKPNTFGCLQEIIVSDFFGETNPKYSFQHQGEIKKKPREMY